MSAATGLAHRRRDWNDDDRRVLWHRRRTRKWAFARIAQELDRTARSCEDEFERLLADVLARSARVAARRERFRREIEDSHFWDSVDDKVAEKAGGFLPPTENMRKRLRADVVLKLYNQGSITRAEHDAALGIRDILHAVGRGLFPVQSLVDLGTHIDGGSPYRDPLGRMKKAEYETWAKVFVPWANAMGRVPVGNSGRYLRELVEDIVVENIGPRQADKAYRIGNGRALTYLKQGLSDYAQRAGFISKGRAA